MRISLPRRHGSASVPRLLALAAAITAAAPAASGAQVVRGTVTEQASGAAARGALVMLLDSAGAHAASVISDGAGAFRIPAPGAGTYRVRIDRVGARGVTSPAFVLAAGEERVLSLRVPSSDAVALAGVAAEGSPRCGPLPDDGTGDVARVWDEARKALVLTVRAASDGMVAYDFTLYRADTDVRGRRITNRETTRTIDARVGEKVPFASRPARELARLGYVRAGAGGIEWYGPDAEVLLSDLFLEQHCFYLRRGEGERAGWVGLAFQPVLARGMPDVRGVLWLDERSAELRRLDFTYTGVELRDVQASDTAPAPTEPAGEVHFARTAGGAWIVSRWELRGVQAERVIGSPRGGLALHRPQRWMVVGGYIHGVATDAPPAPAEPAAPSDAPPPPPRPVEEIILPR
jgi:hypothetical protein